MVTFLRTFTANFLKKSVLYKLFVVFLLTLFFALLYKILIPRATAFGCMDDCNNMMGGYFLLHGKKMFTEIFFNHQPFMAYISEVVQSVTHPQNLYEIILRHRQFSLFFDFVSQSLLFLRFGVLSLPFAILYEVTKFYIGGDRFLAEGYIVYPLVYLLGIVYAKFFNKKVLQLDYYVSSFLVWFILFMREPYSIVVIMLFVTILWGRKERRTKIYAGVVFLCLSTLTLFSYNLNEYFYNVVYVNKTNLAAENADTGFLGIGIYKSFIYPIVIYFQGIWSFFRIMEIGVASLFLLVSGFFAWEKKWKWLLFLWILLGTANIRQVVPGAEYYGIFHLVPWYGLTIFATCLMLWDIKTWHKKTFFTGLVGILLLVLFTIFSKNSYIHDKINQQDELITNYGNVLQVGNVVGVLSTPTNTLFVDGFDDMIYFVAHRYSDYQYSWYTSLMPQYKKYTDARVAMFRSNPPDFYYGSCPKQKDVNFLLPSFVKGNYVRLYNLDKPSCLWIKKSVLPRISAFQWQQAHSFLYSLQPLKRS